MIELTHEQHLTLERDGEPLRAVDPATHEEYVLLRADRFDLLKAALSGDEKWVRDAYPAAMEVMAREGWHDPRMDVYDTLDSGAES